MKGRTRSRHLIIGLVGLSSVIIIHEMGHFIACKIFGIHTPIFSLGFGPRLLAFTPWTTTFQLAMLPIGGYVTMDQIDFATRSYIVKLIVISAGIICNIAFASSALYYLLYKSRLTIDTEPDNTTIVDGETPVPVYNGDSDGDSPRERIIFLQNMTSRLFQKYGFHGIIGPIGLMSIIGASVSYGRDFFLFILAVLSFNIGMFNLLPIPGLDGSQLFAVTIEKIAGSYANAADVMQTLFLIIVLMFIAFITLRDVARLTKRN